MYDARTSLVAGVMAVVLCVIASTALAGDEDGITGHRQRAAGDSEGLGGLVSRSRATAGDIDGVPGDRDNVNGQRIQIADGDSDSVAGKRISYYVLPMVCGDPEGISGYVSLLYWSPYLW